MKKLLFYYCYIPTDFYALTRSVKFVYNMHFKLLREYANIFDKVHIHFGIDNPDDTELLEQWKNIFEKIFEKDKLNFFIHKNNKVSRDTGIYRDYLIKDLILYKDYLVFFAHSKGVGNVSVDYHLKLRDKFDIYEWIIALYYFNLHNFDKIEKILEEKISYGSMFLNLMNLDLPKGTYRRNIYGWIYSGSFQWININALLNFIKLNNINLDRLPNINQRYFSEDFLGTIFPESMAGRYMNKNIENTLFFNDYQDVETHIKYLYPDEWIDFLKFFDNILNYSNIQ